MKKLDRGTVVAFLLGAMAFLLAYANAAVYQPGRIIQLVAAIVAFVVGVIWLVISVALWCTSGERNA